METTTAQASKTHATALRAIAAFYLVGTLVLSYTHIVHLFQTWGLNDYQAYLVPLFIDGFAALGLLARHPSLDVRTRKLGTWLTITAGSMSLYANVAAADSKGGKIFGFLMVAGLIVAEVLAAKTKTAPVKPLTPAQKGAMTRAANAKLTPAQKAARTRKANARKARAAAPVAAPVAA